MHVGSSLFGKIISPLRRSVAWKLAIIVVGPVMALGLTMLAARHSDGLRLQSEATYFLAYEELGQVSAVNANLTLIASQLSSYLENRAESAEDEMRGAMANVQMALTNLKASSDAGIREAAATADAAINRLQNTFTSLQKRVVQVGRTSSEGVTDELDKLTEILASMFEGAVSTDEKFKPLAENFADLRGLELRYRWKRDETLTTRIDFLRSNLLSGLSKADFDKGQADLLRTTLMKQRSVVESWQDSIQLERMQRDDALQHAKHVQTAAIGMRERAEVRQAEARHMNKTADDTARFFTLLAGVLSTIISIAMIYLVGRSLGRALSRLAASMQRVASGEAGVEVPYSARLDEIGDMGRALGIFQQSIVERAELASAAEKGAKLRMERGEQIEGAVRSFAASVEAALGQLRSSAAKMREASTTLESNSDDLAQHAEVAGRSTATASNEVSSVAVAAEQLAKSVDEVSRQAVRSTQVASNAVDQSKQASGMMSGLVAEADRIGDVVELIRSIAVQTNLLALNATIEAARAGDAGRGFAVVASEVKALATQTAKATEDIVERIIAIQTSSGYVGTAISEIGSILSEMSGIATSVAAAVEEQSSAIATISDNVNEAARSSAEGAVAIQNAGARVSASRETAGMIAQVAQGVTEESERIEAVVSSFLGDVRAA